MSVATFASCAASRQRRGRDPTAHGFASVNGQIVLLCEDCFNTEEKTSGAIIRKYWNAPDIKISEGGTYDDIDEIREIADAIKERDDKPTN
jgi:hypothetical protein